MGRFVRKIAFCIAVGLVVGGAVSFYYKIPIYLIDGVKTPNAIRYQLYIEDGDDRYRPYHYSYDFALGSIFAAIATGATMIIVVLTHREN